MAQSPQQENNENSAAAANQVRPIQREKYTRWTEEEHRLFLRGLETYGKSNWTKISKHAVVTKSPAQVASHAQKYFLRQERGKKKTRASIHDITLGNDLVVAQQVPQHNNNPEEQHPIQVQQLHEIHKAQDMIGSPSDNSMDHHNPTPNHFIDPYYNSWVPTPLHHLDQQMLQELQQELNPPHNVSPYEMYGFKSDPRTYK